MKFLCDQMLARLGRWLRAAGYDTAIVESSLHDREIFDWSVKENRLLLTRDKHFLEMPDPKQLVIWLKGNTLEECVRELTGKLTINWMIAPFSRCMICNTLLDEAPLHLYERLPQDIAKQERPVRYCSHCDQLFWIGSHTDRMLKQLSEWDDG